MIKMREELKITRAVHDYFNEKIPSGGTTGISFPHRLGS